VNKTPTRDAAIALTDGVGMAIGDAMPKALVRADGDARG